MKLLLKREPFLKAFSKAAAVAPARAYSPAITNVLLTANKDGSSLEATDLEVSIRVELSDEIQIENGGGKALLPAALFRQMLSECSDEFLKLSVDEKRSATLSGQWAKHQLQTQKADEFPTVSVTDARPAFESPCRAVVAGLKAVTPCVGETKFCTGFTLLQIKDSAFFLVGTEGHVLGAFEREIDESGELTQDALIPPKAAKMIAAALADRDDTASVGMSSNWVRFHAGELTVLARLGEGRFPKWQNCLSPGAKQSAAIATPAGVLKAAIRQATITNQSEYENKATIEFAEGELSVSSGAEVGKSVVSIPISYGGQRFSVVVNWKYLMTALAGFENADEIELRCPGPDGPILLTFGGLFYVIYTIQVN